MIQGKSKLFKLKKRNVTATRTDLVLKMVVQLKAKAHGQSGQHGLSAAENAVEENRWLPGPAQEVKIVKDRRECLVSAIWSGAVESGVVGQTGLAAR